MVLTNEEGREGGERELIYCPPCFRRICERDGIWNPESGIRNAESEIRNTEFATLFLLLFVENHFAFTIFFCISFFKIIEYYAGSLRSLLSLL